ncbi:Hypothetical protein FKW44_012443, partial [Caligus rogercresseyi]
MKDSAQTNKIHSSRPMIVLDNKVKDAAAVKTFPEDCSSSWGRNAVSPDVTQRKAAMIQAYTFNFTQ